MSLRRRRRGAHRAVAQVDIRDANAPRVYKTGEEVYKAVCSACHAAGTAGAPKFGNAADWAPRIARRLTTRCCTTRSTGKGAMPARGGTSPDDYSDFEIARAIVYMANNSGGKLRGTRAASAGRGGRGRCSGAAPAAAASGAQDNAQAAAAVAALAAVPQDGCAHRPAGAQSADASQAGKALYSKCARRVTRPAC